MLVDELRLLLMIEKPLQDGVALLTRQLHDVGGEAGIDEQAFLPRCRVAAYYRMDNRRVRRPRMLPFSGVGAVGRKGFGEIMRGGQAIEEALQPRGQRLIGRHHV